MLKKLKSLFILEDENDKKELKVQEGSEKRTANDSLTSDENFTDVHSDEVVELDLDHPTDLEGTPDPKFIDILLKAIEKNNTAGFDYLEYKQSLQSLKNMSMDEATQYKSAFAMAKTMGTTAPKLIESANHYIGVLNNEEKKFKEALVNQRNTQIKGRESNLAKLQQSIESKTQEIEKLKADIEKTKVQLDKVRQEINKSAAKVEATNDKFHLAFKIVMLQIQEDVQKMKEYLK